MFLATFRTLRESYLEYQAGAMLQARWGPLIGVVGYPAFYVLWEYVLPQPYNSLVASGIGFSGSLVLYLLSIRPLLPTPVVIAARYLVTIYNMPFFFTFMLLMNGSNATWQLSCMGGFIYLLLLSDGPNALMMAVLGITAACALYSGIATPPVFDQSFFVALAAIAFVMGGYALLARRDSLIHQQRLRGASLMASAIAHELRTPLAGIRLDAEQCSRLVPALAEAQRWAVDNGWRSATGSMRTIEQVPEALDRILQHARAADSVINMVLMSVAPLARRVTSEPVDMQATVAGAVRDYPMRPGQRALVSLDLAPGVIVEGGELALRHVVFNLLKNALRALDQRGGGAITVRSYTDARRAYLIVSDTGMGIKHADLPFLFVPFFTLQSTGQGTGVGLAFCKQVVESMDGSIECKSRYGEGTEFVLSFPLIRTLASAAGIQAADTAGASR